MRYRLMATYRGVPYEVGLGPSNSDVVLFAACPPPEELGFEPATGHWRKQVIRAEIDALWESRPVGIFRGEPCIVLDDPGERMHIAYLGTDAARAVQLGYWQIDRGVFELLTQRDEVTGLTEERVDKPLRWSEQPGESGPAPTYPYGTAPWPILASSAPPPQPPPDADSPLALSPLVSAPLADVPPASALPADLPPASAQPSSTPSADLPPAPTPKPAPRQRTPRWPAPSHPALRQPPPCRSAPPTPAPHQPTCHRPTSHRPGPPSQPPADPHPPSQPPTSRPATGQRPATQRSASRPPAGPHPPRQPPTSRPATGRRPTGQGPLSRLPATQRPTTWCPATGRSVSRPPARTGHASRRPRPAGRSCAIGCLRAGKWQCLSGHRWLARGRGGWDGSPPGEPGSRETALVSGSGWLTSRARHAWLPRPAECRPDGQHAGAHHAGKRHASPRHAGRRHAGDIGGRAARRHRVPTREIFCELADLASIPRATYALETETDGAMCLLPTPDGFEVFNAAGGSRHEVRFFAEEEAAYFYLFGVLAAEAIRNGALAPTAGAASLHSGGV